MDGDLQSAGASYKKEGLRTDTDDVRSAHVPPTRSVQSDSPRSLENCTSGILPQATLEASSMGTNFKALQHLHQPLAEPWTEMGSLSMALGNPLFSCKSSRVGIGQAVGSQLAAYSGPAAPAQGLGVMGD